MKEPQAVDYQGAWLYGIGFACPKTIYRDRDLVCEDFVKKAKALFAGKTPTVFLRRNPIWECGNKTLIGKKRRSVKAFGVIYKVGIILYCKSAFFQIAV
ncbi:MAG: hypothetical protein IJX87_04420 [Clostridia bacterium]|nr:hypothetical protein [Clostridia bacterium]